MNHDDKSVWVETAKNHIEKTKLEGPRKADVLISGGGMTGMLTACKLKMLGIDCIVVEAKTIGGGATQNTTAKITAQHGLIYADIIKRYGAEKARLYYEANTNAINDFRDLSVLYPCDFESKTAFVYSADNRLKLEREANAYLKIGIPAKIDDNLPLPIATQGAVRMENQAQFNPLKLLHSLASELDIYENTFVKRIEGNQAITNNGSIRAKHIVLATHYPLINIPGLYFMKLYQHRSYVIALESAADVNGMYVDEKQNGMSFRNYQDLLFIGGGDHKTGNFKQNYGYEPLRTLAKSAYPNATEKYRWATQDCMSLDGIPYIGKLQARKNNIYVATGFNKWGMTSGMVAAKILRDLIINGASEYESLFSPQRLMFTKQLMVNIGTSAAGLLRIGGPRCSHMGCKLNRNEPERTWDCPCHGSCFDEKGNIINNPAKKRIRL